MKWFNYFLIILTWSLILTTAQAQGVWNWQRLPGGNVEKIVQVYEELSNDTELFGIWLPSKDGTNNWIKFNYSSQTWDFSGLEEFDGYDNYCQGGDECFISSTPYAISAKYHGTQTYSYGGSNWGYVTNEVVRNYGQRWEDAVFCSDGNNAYNANYFVLSNAYDWYPDNTTAMHKKLCLSQDGGSPSITSTISGTQDFSYPKMYRDLDSRRGNYIYTWPNWDGTAPASDRRFLRVVISQTAPNMQATLQDAWGTVTDYDLIKVHNFYQYPPDPNTSTTRYQFLLAEVQQQSVGTTKQRIFYRSGTDGSYSTWALICDDLEGHLNSLQSNPSVNFFAIKRISDSEFHIYLTFAGSGGYPDHAFININNGPSNYTAERFPAVADDWTYLKKMTTHAIALNHWWTGNGEQVIISTNKTGVQMANAYLSGSSPYIRVSTILSDGILTNGSTTANKGGAMIWGTYPLLNSSSQWEYYLLGHSGIFRENIIPGGLPTLNKMGLMTSPISVSNVLGQPDFHACWMSAVKSPWQNNEICMGRLNDSYSFSKSGDATVHSSGNRGGLWHMSTTSTSSQPTRYSTPSDAHTYNLITDENKGSTHRLYLALQEQSAVDAEDLDVFTTAAELQREDTENGALSYVANTGNNNHGLNLEEQQNISGFGTLYPIFTVAKTHPDANIEGIVYGAGISVADWGEEPGSQNGLSSTNYGGGLGIIYKDVSQTWQKDRIIRVDHTIQTDPAWFECPKSILVENVENNETDHHYHAQILCATGSYQLSRSFEDFGRYGGLYKIIRDDVNHVWVKTDITPNTATAYQLRCKSGNLTAYNYNSSTKALQPLTNPSVGSVASYTFSGTNYYFCTTAGEKNVTSGTQHDERICHLWVQKAININNLQKPSWIKYPGTGTNAGRIPYDKRPSDLVENYIGSLALLPVSGGNPRQVRIIAGTNCYFTEFYGDETIDTSVTWSGEVILGGDITITNGATLTLNPDCQVMALDTFAITLDSGYVKVTYPDSTKPVFTAAEGLRWKGLTVKNMHPDSTLTLENLEIRNANIGLYLNDGASRTVKVRIENCLFDGNGTGIAGREGDQVVIENCTILNCVKDTVDSNGDGIYLFGLTSGGSHAIENCIISDNDGCGIRLSGCTASSFKIRNNDIHDNLEQNSSGYTTWAGIYCYSSSPKILTTEISESRGYPLSITHTSAPYLCQGPDSTNSFTLAMTPPDTYAVVFADGGFPVSNNAYNNFSHNGSGSALLIRDITGSPPSRTVEHNWWGINPPCSTQFYPTNNYDFTPYQTSAVSFSGGEPERGCSSLDTSAYELLSEALALAGQGNYSQAYSMLTSMVSVFTEEEDAVSQALPHVLKIGTQAGVLPQTMYAYFNSLYLSNTDNLIGKTARKARNDCSLLMGNYQDAINDYQAIISNPPSLTDSVFAVLDANQAYLLMCGSGMPGIQAMSQPTALNPVTLNEYVKRENALLSLLYGNGTAKKGPALPKTFALYQNFPNPFNPATTICYDLPEMAQVKICIYNMMGQKVVTLVDGPAQAGIHRVIWDSNRSGKILASGIYIYRIEAKGQVTGQKFVKAKKMLMLK